MAHAMGNETLDSQAPNLALALSGGGVRAMAFHSGVLKWLAEHRHFESVSKISTVSGGSLLVGTLFAMAKMSWPSSTEYLSAHFPALRSMLCSRSLQRDAAKRLRNPMNWRFLLSRANLLSSALRTDWGIVHALSDLPAIPVWSINGTNAENGKRFRFQRNTMGDYLTGYAEPGQFKLSDAMAVSAAFPGGFGPLALNTRKHTWKRRAWGASDESASEIRLEYDHLHLYDGGVYDNLGLEPFFDSGKQLLKVNKTRLLVSDAGAPLGGGRLARGSLNPFRLKRVADIMSDQSRALRVRSYLHFLDTHPGSGTLIDISSKEGSSEADTQFCSSFPTSLRKLRTSEFDTIARHGYKLASRWASNMFDPDYGPH